MSKATELYKKFMVQKSVLDTLRVYIEITDDFLAKMRQAGLLDEDEMIVVQVCVIYTLPHKLRYGLVTVNIFPHFIRLFY